MENRPRKTLQYLLSLAVAAVLLYFSFRGIKWADLRTALASCRWGFVLLAMAVGVSAFVLRALRWRMLLLPIDPSLGRLPVLNAVNISYLINLVFPRVGEFVRCGYITAHSVPGEDGRKKASYDKVLGTVVADRLWDVLSLLTLSAAVALLLWKRFGSFMQERMIAPLLGSGSSSAALLGGALALTVLCLFLVGRFRGTSPLCRKVWSFFAGILAGLRSSFRIRRFWLFLLLTVLIWTSYWMQSLSIVWAVDGLLPEGVCLGPLDALFLMVVGSLSSLIPVPGGFGAFHYLVSLALSTLYGIPLETAVIFATLSHESQILVQALCGGVSYATESLSP